MFDITEMHKRKRRKRKRRRRRRGEREKMEEEAEEEKHPVGGLRRVKYVKVFRLPLHSG